MSKTVLGCNVHDKKLTVSYIAALNQTYLALEGDFSLPDGVWLYACPRCMNERLCACWDQKLVCVLQQEA